MRLDQVIPKLTNNKKNLVEVSVDCPNGPPKRLMHYPKPLIEPNYMKGHCNMFLNSNTSIAVEKPPRSKLLIHKKGFLLILKIETHCTSMKW
jgi:hypothetical protein